MHGPVGSTEHGGGRGKGFDRMLILVRKVQQGIWIGDDILIKILDVERDRVKLGIEAPSDVRVVRQELLDRDVPADQVEVEEST